MGLKQREQKIFANILQSDGTIRVQGNEGEPGVIRRDYELKNGTKGTKFERVYHELSGVITGINFHEGDYGKSLHLTVSDDEPIILSVALKSNYADDIMKKLPNINIAELVTLKPYSFKDKKTGKTKRGVSISQNENKIFSYFHDEKNNPINDFPDAEKTIGKDPKTFDSDDWKEYFLKANRFLVDFIEKNVIPAMPATSIPEANNETKPVSDEGNSENESWNDNDVEVPNPPFN